MRGGSGWVPEWGSELSPTLSLCRWDAAEALGGHRLRGWLPGGHPGRAHGRRRPLLPPQHLGAAAQVPQRSGMGVPTSPSEQGDVLVGVWQGGLRSRPFLVPRPHHHPVHSLYGRGRAAGRPHRHHLTGPALLLRVPPLPQGQAWHRVPPHPGEAGEERDRQQHWHCPQCHQKGGCLMIIPQRAASVPIPGFGGHGVLLWGARLQPPFPAGWQ